MSEANVTGDQKAEVELIQNRISFQQEVKMFFAHFQSNWLFYQPSMKWTQALNTLDVEYCRPILTKYPSGPNYLGPG